MLVGLKMNLEKTKLMSVEADVRKEIEHELIEKNPRIYLFRPRYETREGKPNSGNNRKSRTNMGCL